MSPLAELMLFLAFLFDLGVNAPLLARDPRVGDGVVTDEIFESGLAAAEKFPKDDVCVLVIGTEDNGAA